MSENEGMRTTQSDGQGSPFPLGWVHAVLRGHLPRFRWYDIGWARIRGCDTCESKKATRYADATRRIPRKEAL